MLLFKLLLTSLIVLEVFFLIYIEFFSEMFITTYKQLVENENRGKIVKNLNERYKNHDMLMLYFYVRYVKYLYYILILAPFGPVILFNSTTINQKSFINTKSSIIFKVLKITLLSLCLLLGDNNMWKYLYNLIINLIN